MKNYKYFKELIRINKEVYQYGGTSNLRATEEEIDGFESVLSELYTASGSNLYTTLKSILHACALMYSYQPFYDGNTRTMKRFLVDYLKRNGINVIIGNNDIIIPVYYPGEDNGISKESIYRLKKRIMN